MTPDLRAAKIDTVFPLRLKAGRTAYREAGTGEVVLFIHGVGLNADAWQLQMDAFQSTHRVIALDMLGHGQSELPPSNATLDDYIEQVRELMDELAIPTASVVGHSMGGLVAMGFALRYPSRTLRLGVLNSVYERDELRRSAVETRAAQIEASQTPGNVDEPIRRWFADQHSTPLAQTVRDWLKQVNPRGYAAAYRVFATSDRLFSGQLGSIRAPALFATGSLDPNSTSQMANSMADAVPGARCVVLEGERHMMNLTASDATNGLLRDLLARHPAQIDPRELRKAFGSFMTGVTVVTTRDLDGTPRGFTANSFTSVSLDPPLLLVCIAKSAASLESFSKADGFAVNILSEAQKEVSGIFASKRPDKFEQVVWHDSALKHPLIDGAVASFDCHRDRLIDAGDHVILMGAIESFEHLDAPPLGYARGGYVTLGLEQAAVSAAALGGSIIGAILEYDGKLLVTAAADGGDSLPQQSKGTVSMLVDHLQRSGLEIDLGFLFAVYENPTTRIQSIWYRGTASGRLPDGAHLVPFSEIDTLAIPDAAIRTMLQRYADERVGGRFRIYSGDHERGEVRAVD